MQRAVPYLVGEAGIRQIIDIGTGIPGAGNVHEIAGQIAPDTRVVYVDNDHRKSGCTHAYRAVRLKRIRPITFTNSCQFEDPVMESFPYYNF
jgi:hypothetical protein